MTGFRTAALVALVTSSMNNKSKSIRVDAKSIRLGEDPIALRPKLSVWKSQTKLYDDPHRSKLSVEVKTMDTTTTGNLVATEQLMASKTRTYIEQTMLSGSRVSTSAAQELEKATCTLSYMDLSKGVLEAVGNTISHNKVVTSLTMWETSLCPRMTATLAAGLAGNRRITFLDLSHNKHLTCKGAASLAKALDPPNNFGHTLKELRLEFCGISKGVIALSDTLAFNTSLKVLSLNHNSISDMGVRAVAQMLENNLALQCLKMGYNHIGAAGALMLASALRSTTTLQRLDVSHNGLERGGLEIASALGSNYSLVNLDLSYTRASQDVCLVVVEALRVNTVLQELILDGNPVGLNGGRFCIHALQNAACLKLLSLNNCDFSVVGPVGSTSSSANLQLDDLDKHYVLNLAMPEQHAAAGELCLFNLNMGGKCITNAEFDGRSLKNIGQMPWPEQMPNKGKFAFNFRSNFEHQKALPIPSQREMTTILEQINNKDISDQAKLSILTVFASSYHFHCAQAGLIVLGFSGGLEQTSAAVKLYTRVVDQEHLPALLQRLPSVTQSNVMDNLGPFGRLFRYKNPSGAYKFNLSMDMHHGFVKALYEKQQEEGKHYCWRNVEWEGKSYPPNYRMPMAWGGRIPQHGMLSLDFASHDRPRPKPNGKQANALNAHEMRQLYTAISGVHDFEQRQTATRTDDERICVLKELSCQIQVTTAQAISIMSAVSSMAARVEVAMMLYSQIVDVNDRWRLVYAMEGLSQALMYRRLGPDLIYHPQHNSIHFLLDTSDPQSMTLAKSLCAAAIRDNKRQFLHNLRVGGKPKVIPETVALWTVIVMETPEPVLEFDYLGEDWRQIVRVYQDSQGNPLKVPIEPTDEERSPENLQLIREWASRCDFARARTLHQTFAPKAEPESKKLTDHERQKRQREREARESLERERESTVWFAYYSHFLKEHILKYEAHPEETPLEKYAKEVLFADLVLITGTGKLTVKVVEDMMRRKLGEHAVTRPMIDLRRAMCAKPVLTHSKSNAARGKVTAAEIKARREALLKEGAEDPATNIYSITKLSHVETKKEKDQGPADLVPLETELDHENLYQFSVTFFPPTSLMLHGYSSRTNFAPHCSEKVKVKGQEKMDERKAVALWRLGRKGHRCRTSRNIEMQKGAQTEGEAYSCKSRRGSISKEELQKIQKNQKNQKIQKIQKIQRRFPIPADAVFPIKISKLDYQKGSYDKEINLAEGEPQENTPGDINPGRGVSPIGTWARVPSPQDMKAELMRDLSEE